MAETGLEIEYSHTNLQNDHWMLGVLSNDTYRDRLETRLFNTDLFNAVIDDYKEFGPGEPDIDLFNRA